MNVVGFVLLLPCLLLVNESEDCDLTINFFGLFWLIMLFVLAQTKIGKWYIKELEKTQGDLYGKDDK